MSRNIVALKDGRAPRRIGLVGDFLRFEIAGDRCINFQPRNLAWLQQLFVPAIRDVVPDARQELLLAPDRLDAMAAVCANRDVLDAYRRDPAAIWACLYGAEQATAFQELFDRLLEFDFVVGFEMPPLVKRQLHRAGVPYVNFFVHPLRFLRDLCLGASTNSLQVLEGLRACALADAEVFNQARRYTAYFRRRQLESLAIPPGLPVLIGQTDRDSVLITSQGRFDNWASHAESLQDALSDTDAVVFLEHPFARGSSRLAQEIRSIAGKTVITSNANGYGLLMSNPDIPFVMTLASSLGVEAQALGLEAKFLLADPREKFIVPGVDLPFTQPCGHAILLGDFWRAVLVGPDERGAGRSSCASVDAFPLGENYLRHSLDAWAFRGLQNGLEGHVVRKTVFWTSGLSDVRQDDVLEGLLGFAPDGRRSEHQTAQRGRQVGVDLEQVEQPLALEERREVQLNVPAVSAMLIDGFHAPESWGCWTSALHSELLIAVDAEAVRQGCQLQLTLRMRLYDGLVDRSPVMKLSTCGGKTLGFVFFRAGAASQDICMTVPVADALVSVCFDLSLIDSPAARGESADMRWLGVAVESLVLHCLPAACADARDSGIEDEQALWGLDTRQALITLR